MSFIFSSRFRVTLIIVALCLVCATSGLVLGFVLGVKHERHRNDPTAWTVDVMKAFRSKLKPDAAQEKALQAIVDRAASSVVQTRDHALGDVTEAIDTMIGEVRQVLRPEQIPVFNEMMKSRGKTTVDMLKVKPPKK